MRRNVELAAIVLVPVISIIVALLAMGGYTARLTAAESLLKSVDSAQRTDHDIVIEMHTQIGEIHEWLKAKQSAPPRQ